MRLPHLIYAIALLGLPAAAYAETMPGKSGDAPSQIEITADQSLEYYQDAHIYVARGNAKAVRGDMVVEADLLTAHERESPPGIRDQQQPKQKPAKAAPNADDTGASNLDKLTAEGNVRITDPRQRITGEHAVDDLDKHVAVVTGKNLKYETEKETVTAKDSLEYWDEKKIAVARGNAVAISGDRHIESDVLTAEFRDAPNGGDQQLWKMTSEGHVVVITKGDVSRGDKAVYDVARDIAILTGHVRITRNDGTQLTGDVAESDFKTNQSRLLNQGHGRVRALLASKTTGKATAAKSNDKTNP